MVAEAEQMLHALESDIAQYGGQPISIEDPVVLAEPSASATVSGGVVQNIESASPGSLPDSEPAEHPGDASNAAKVTVEAIPEENEAAPAASQADAETPSKSSTGSQNDTDTTALKIVPPRQNA